MKRILCPVDFSESAINAVQYAGKLAQNINAGITLINVQILAELAPEFVVYGKDVNVQVSSSRLEELSEEVIRIFKVPCGFEVEVSTFSFGSIIGSKALGYDLIVMGTQGNHSIWRSLFGTHTYKVIRETKVPLLLVPEYCIYSEIKSMVFAFDYWRTNQLPLSSLIQFAKTLGSTILVLEVMEESHSTKADDEIREGQKQIKQLYADEDIDIKFDTIHINEIAAGIHDYMLKNRADILALCALEHPIFEKLFHDSVIKDISSIASYPVLIFH